MAEARPLDLSERLADELDRSGNLLEQLAVQLCLDPVVFERHAVALQRFDQITQMIGEIALILRRHDTQGDAQTAIRLDAMKERMFDAHS